MPVVRFQWDARLVGVRQEVCPRARWDRAGKVWQMTDEEASAFLKAGHSRLDFCRSQGRIAIDGKEWVVGFVQGAPLLAQ